MKKEDLLKAVKQAILQQAIEGKLTKDWREENPNTEPASELLKRIKAEKEKLIKEKKIRKENPLPPITQEEIPFELPENWVWCRFKDIVTYRKGKKPSVLVKTRSKEYPIPYIDIAAFEKNQITQYTNDPKAVLCNKENILLVWDGSRMGLVGTNAEGAVGSTLVRIDLFLLNKEFLFILLKSKFEFFNSNPKQAGLPHMNGPLLDKMVIGLPSLAEQKAIVEKVEALVQQLEMVDRGESIEDLPVIHPQARKLIELYDKINRTINEIQSQKQLVKQLKQSILQEAIQGKLTAGWREENPNTEPASELLKRIKAEKEKLIKEKKIKKEKPLPPITQDEIPFELPKGWVWCRLGEIAINIHYGATKSANIKIKEVRLLRITDIQNNKVNWENVPGCEFSERDLNTYKLVDNDILIARTGGTIGKSFIVKNIPVNSIFASYLIRIIPSVNIYAEYVKTFLDGPLYWKQLFEAAWGAGQPNVNSTKLKKIKIPLPPLVEQKVIVEKVENLMQKISAMEEEITKSEEYVQMLMQAVLKETFDEKKE